MRRFWSGKPSSAASQLTALDEPKALQDALASASLVMNDEVERAEAELSKGASPFHKLGVAVTFFLRATLGFEKEIIEQARIKLDEAAEAAYEHQRRAIADPATAHRSSIYPPGSEYALCHAESQLMSVVVAVLNESLTESLKGFYKMRKAFNTLHELREAETRYLSQQRGRSIQNLQEPSASASTSGSGDALSTANTSEVADLAPSSATVSDHGDDIDFQDAKESLLGNASTDTTEGTIDGSMLSDKHLSDAQHHSAPTHSTTTANHIKADASTLEAEYQMETFTTDPTDIFIHAGTSLCFGILQLILSMIPPAFAKILNIFSFRGDRAEGLKMLWSATRYKSNINGALAGLITLGYYNTALEACDIVPSDAIPRAKLRLLLREMRELYPNSRLWIMEEAKVFAAEHDLERAVAMLRDDSSTSLRQIQALGRFDLGLNLMYLGRYKECAETFIECVGLNNWNPAPYYYIAGACYVELYRLHRSSDSDQADQYAKRAEKYLAEVPLNLGKKRLMGRQLPINAFVSRKITKWESRAKRRNCRLVDAVGASPTIETAYFWSGCQRMSQEQLDNALERCVWSSNIVQNPNWTNEDADEKAIVSFLRAVCLRFSGLIVDARAVLRDEVLQLQLHELKACEHADTWVLPVGHYEMAVCAWEEAGSKDKDDPKLLECSEHLAKIEKWESFELEARVGLKVATARETLQKCGISQS